MIERRQFLVLIMMICLLSAFGTLYLGTSRVSAADPGKIYISPDWAHTGDPTLALGTDHTISIWTDCTRTDIWGYEFSLTFNSSVLNCIGVVNGDLITGGPWGEMWDDGVIDNPAGILDDVGNGFVAVEGYPVPVTSGSGTSILANVTFTVVGYGISNLTLVDNPRLIGYDSESGKYNIIDNTVLGRIGSGIFYNIFLGDMTDDTPGILPDAPDGDVDGFDLGAFADAYGTSEGHPDFDPLGDLTDDSPGVPPDLPDGDIDGFDLGVFADNYGRTYP